MTTTAPETKQSSPTAYWSTENLNETSLHRVPYTLQPLSLINSL